MQPFWVQASFSGWLRNRYHCRRPPPPHLLNLISNLEFSHYNREHRPLTIGFKSGFFLCAPKKKNSRAPKLKKMETQEKNSRKNTYPGQKEKKTVRKFAQITSNVLKFKCFRSENCKFPQKNSSFHAKNLQVPNFSTE